MDDDDSLRRMLAEILTDAGYQVSTCANGRAALEALELGLPDAVLSDVQMPDMDGLELLRAVRARDIDVPVVLCTGGPTLETAIQAVERGALQYLVRPVPTDRLLEAVGRAVNLGLLARLKRQALQSAGFAGAMRERADLQGPFERALGALWMAAQPIVRARDGTVAAYELLVRTAERTFAGPPALIGAAERLGRLADLGRTIRATVAGLMETSLAVGDVYVNLHPLDLADDALLDAAAPCRCTRRAWCWRSRSAPAWIRSRTSRVAWPRCARWGTGSRSTTWGPAMRASRASPPWRPSS